jgi:hypothetical protein
LTGRIIVLTTPIKISVHQEQLINYLFGRTLYRFDKVVKVHPPFRTPRKNSPHNVIKINLRVANLYPDKGKFHPGKHLRFDKVLNSFNVFELLYQGRKFFGLGIARKHGLINHTQHFLAAFNKYSSLGSAILKLDNSATAHLICPKINIVVLGKTCECFNPQVYPLVFGSRIQKGTYDEKRRTKIVRS